MGFAVSLFYFIFIIVFLINDANLADYYAKAHALYWYMCCVC